VTAHKLKYAVLVFTCHSLGGSSIASLQKFTVAFAHTGRATRWALPCILVCIVLLSYVGLTLILPFRLDGQRRLSAEFWLRHFRAKPFAIPNRPISRMLYNVRLLPNLGGKPPSFLGVGAFVNRHHFRLTGQVWFGSHGLSFIYDAAFQPGMFPRGNSPGNFLQNGGFWSKKWCKA